MKAVLIVYNTEIESEIKDALAKLDADCYTVFTSVLGKGLKSEPHLNTEIWPGSNNAVLIVTEHDKASAILAKITEMRKTLGHEGIKAFSWQIESVT